MLKLLLAVFFLGGCAYADDKPPASGAVVAKKPASAAAVVSSDRFICAAPAGWESRRDREKESKTRIQKLELLGPRAEKAPVFIYASFYGAANTAFAGYEDFIERNSKNILGETESDTEKFSPVTKTTLAGKKAFAFDSEIKEYLHPESKSEESVIIKEKFYVVPERGGFFVLHYYAPSSAFNKHLAVFRKFVSSCKIR
jgi:hypothetical protein